MSEKEFAQFQVKLQAVLTELKKVEESKVRRRLLVSMRELLAEADRLTVESPTEE
jgi:hypothetical protein